MEYIPKDLQDDIISTAWELLIAHNYNKDHAIKTLRAQLNAYSVEHVNGVASLYSHVMDVICKNHSGGNTKR